MRFSLLDRSRTRVGRPEQAALPDSLERAIAAEQQGYHRFWAAEHHTVPGIASGSPAVLLAAIGQRTSRIRLGSGGVMLPNHRPLVVAEQFLMLASLAPGRVDLGLGRSLGFTAPVREALGRTGSDPARFAQEVTELRDYLEGTAALTARPVVDPPPPLFLLATGSGLDAAAQLGLPVVIGGPVLASEELPARLAAYRRTFRPHRGSAPSVIVSADVLVADTDAAARELALPEVWAMARSRETGVFPPLDSVAAIRGRELSARERSRIERGLETTWAGGERTVTARVEQVLERTGADELLVSGSTFDREALAESDRRVAALLG
ncbi:MsnO8 family LLM class oxidoreductase [Brachybacterium sp. AOP43-C2-M15]|uniref:MsnO8 family LLM class oxidoreductase n=1 Tax=Brachybacterium sp. AOP43-C2-M15 TaxID=3457661 RepID=UPI004034B5CF